LPDLKQLSYLKKKGRLADKRVAALGD